MTPTVTVITVCRNALAALRGTVESVLAQEPGPDEYWIVDALSTDGTVEYLRGLGDRVRWVSERDGGISDAMNKGVRLAAGEWVAHLHAGDHYAPGALAAVREAIAAAPGAGVVCGWMLKHEPAGDVVYRCDPSQLPRDMSINHPATFVRRELFERHGGFAPEFRRAMDYDFFLKLERAGVPFTVLPRVLATMEYGGLSETSLWKTLAESQRVRRARLDRGLERSPLWLLWLYARGGARRGLQALGLSAVVRWYRRRFALLRKG